jgi:hypothetical protein
MDDSFQTVFVWKGAGNRHGIGDVVEAEEWLLRRWPEPYVSTPAHVAARTACLEAWGGTGDPLAARRAFVEAAREAGLLAEE